MEKFIPYEKLSKKEKRKIDQARRQTWGELNPVTRKPTNSRAYNRKRHRIGSAICRLILFYFLILLTFIRVRSIIVLSEFGESEKTMKPIHTKEMAEVNRLYKETDSIYTKYAATHGISTTTLCVLYSLYTAETPCTQTQLVEDWGIPMQTINSCLKALEKSESVRLDFMEGSRKNKQICLTQQGEKMAGKIIAPIVCAENEAFEALTTEEQQSLLRITQKHNALLKKFLLE